jgi:peptide/nickel transport system permease protein
VTSVSAAHSDTRARRRYDLRLLARRHPAVAGGVAILAVVVIATLLAPWLAGHDPLFVDPLARLRPPSGQHWLGTDALGRDVWSRTVYGGRVSLVVGVAAAVIATGAGLLIGLVSGYSRIADALLMRFMDGLMSIPTILLAIALMAVVKASLATVVVAIAVVEVPRVVRLVRGVVLSVREQPYVEAAVVAGSGFATILARHILPNTLAPVVVQATYICSAAILIESLLSFLGAGTPPEVASWGNIMAEGRTYFLVAPWIILAPGVVLALTVLAINLLGDGVREMLDPRFAKRL